MPHANRFEEWAKQVLVADVFDRGPIVNPRQTAPPDAHESPVSLWTTSILPGAIQGFAASAERDPD